MGGTKELRQKLEALVDGYLKFLADPKNPMRRVGVKLSPAQMAQIQEAMEADNKAGAQRLILDLLDEEFGDGKKASTQDLADALQRDAQLKKTRAELLRALFNRAGLERLRAVTDATWREAQARDENTG